MKKSVLSIISISFLFFIMSCSGMMENYSSISVQFPEGTSNHLALMRAADVPQEQITLTLKTTGDFETSESKTFSNIDEINGSEIEIKGIPVDRKITAKLQISIGSNVYYEGTSKEITIKKGDNLVNINLKPSSGKVELEFDLSRGFEIVAYPAGNNSKYYKDRIPYSEEGYIFLPVQNGIPITTGECSWRIIGISGDLELDDEIPEIGFYISNETLSQIEEYNVYAPYSIHCLIIDGNNSASATATFEIEYPSLSITPDFNTPIALWDYGDFGTRNNMIINSTSELAEKNYIDEIVNSNFSLAKDGIYHYGYEGQLYFNSNFVRNGFHNNLLYSDFETNNLYYLAQENNEYIVYKGHETPTIVQIQLSEFFDYTHMAINDNYAAFAKKERGENQTPESISVFKRQDDDSYVECENIIDFDKMKIKQTEYKADYIKDLFIYEDKLFIIVSNFYTKDLSDYNSSLYQNGALVVVDLNLPQNYKIIGLANEEKYFEVPDSDINCPVSIVVHGAPKASDSVFYAPQKIIAIKQEELYIADIGSIINDESEIKKNQNNRRTLINSTKSRIVKVNLKDFCISGTINLDDYKLVKEVPHTASTQYVHYVD